MKVVPKEFRVYSEFCFTHFAKKGGANTGYCGLHVDKNSIVNGLLDAPGGSEARSKQEFIRNYNIFNIVKEESVVGSQEVEKRLKEGGLEKY